jgi:hypothetical protein
MSLVTDMALEAAGFGVRSMNDPVRGWHLHHYTAQHKGLVDSSSAFGAYFSSITAPPMPAPPVPPMPPTPGPTPGPRPGPTPGPRPGPTPGPQPTPDPGAYSMDHAWMSKAAYGDGEALGYLQEQGYAKDDSLALSGLGHFLMDGPSALWSQPNSTTFVKDGKAVISYRGTNITDMADLAADAAIAIGWNHMSGRFWEADRTYQAAVKKYGADNVEVTGHSLGGAEALYVARKYGAGGTVFNPGESPFGEYAEEQIGESGFDRLLGTHVGGSSRVTVVSSNEQWQKALPGWAKFSDDPVSVSAKLYGEKLVFVPEKASYESQAINKAYNSTIFGALHAHKMDNFILSKRKSRLNQSQSQLEAQAKPSAPAEPTEVSSG